MPRVVIRTPKAPAPPATYSQAVRAAGLIFGRAGEHEYDDAIVTRDDVVALRRKVVATVDEAIDEAAVDLVATLKDGRRVHVAVEHAIGSMQRPMTDAMLEVARRNAPIVAERLGYTNVEFRKGRIQDLALDLERLDCELRRLPVGRTSCGWFGRSMRF